MLKTKLIRAGVFLAGFGFVAGATLFAFAWFTVSIPDPNAYVNSQSTIIQYSNGSEIGRIGTQNRQILPLSKIPLRLRNAVMAAEDRNFYSNRAFSATGIARALLNNLKSGSLNGEGGSTITQQYAKTAFLTPSRTVQRKIKELVISLKLENALTKDQILENYLNTIYFGRGSYGVQTAAQQYFNRNANDLSMAQSAVIVSIQPVLVSILAVPLLGERIRSVQVVGLVLGVAGIALLLLPKVFQGDYSSAISEVGIVICVIALLGTSAGYLVQKKLGGDIPFLTGTGLQYAVSAVVFALLSALTEDQRVEWSPEFLFGLAWIVLMLSIGSIVLLYEMLRAGSASKVSSLYYLVPPVAAIQAYFLFDEVIPPIGILGMALAGLGVVLVMRQAVEKTLA